MVPILSALLIIAVVVMDFFVMREYFAARDRTNKATTKQMSNEIIIETFLLVLTVMALTTTFGLIWFLKDIF